jgi:SAM-dependent methyltransferase
MDAMRFSTLAHRAHDLCNPLDEATVDAACARLGLEAMDPGRRPRVIDVGCGKAGMLIRLALRRPIAGIGIDLNPAHLAEGAERAARRRVADSITLLEMDATRFDAAPESFDVAISIGAAHALGGCEPTLRTLRSWLRPGGRLLVGHGYWRREPAPEYLAVLGASASEHGRHADNLALAARLGLEPIADWESDREAWDRYENLYAETALAFAADHPDDPDAAAIVARVERWRDAYRRWGRDTLGFGLDLFAR